MSEISESIETPVKRKKSFLKRIETFSKAIVLPMLFLVGCSGDINPANSSKATNTSTETIKIPDLVSPELQAWLKEKNIDLNIFNPNNPNKCDGRQDGSAMYRKQQGNNWAVRGRGTQDTQIAISQYIEPGSDEHIALNKLLKERLAAEQIASESIESLFALVQSRNNDTGEIDSAVIELIRTGVNDGKFYFITNNANGFPEKIGANGQCVSKTGEYPTGDKNLDYVP